MGPCCTGAQLCSLADEGTADPGAECRESRPPPVAITLGSWALALPEADPRKPQN